MGLGDLNMASTWLTVGNEMTKYLGCLEKLCSSQELEQFLGFGISMFLYI